MGFETVSTPQVGVRQFGVDIAAVGRNPISSEAEALFLFVVKPGNITRSEWSQERTGVRASLEEVLDAYIPGNISPEHAELSIVIVLCCSGELRQEVDSNWAGFTSKQQSKYEVSFQLWNGSRITSLIEQWMMSEQLFPASYRKSLRRTLALLADADYDMSDFYSLIENLLRVDLEGNRTRSKAESVKSIRALILSARMVHTWCEDAGNMRAALLASERLLLRLWSWLADHELLEDRDFVKLLASAYSVYERAGYAIVERVSAVATNRDGLYGYGYDEVTYQIRTFEVLGIIATIGMDQVYRYQYSGIEQHAEASEAVARVLVALIDNNPSAVTPVFDGHAIDIAACLLLLYHTGHRNFAEQWIQLLARNISAGHALGRYYPIQTDSYEDLVELIHGHGRNSELLGLSTILPLLAGWCLILDSAEVYQQIWRIVSGPLSETNLQLWYPDARTEELLYSGCASNDSGFSVHSIVLPDAMAEFRSKLYEQVAAVSPYLGFSFQSAGMQIIGLVASRHFRTEHIPAYWQSLILGSED